MQKLWITAKIFIRTVTGKIISLEVETFETIEKVKKNQEKEKSPSDSQTLIFEEVKLENDKTLADCNIQKDSLINLIVNSKSSMQIVISLSANKTLTLKANPFYTIQNIKPKFKKKKVFILMYKFLFLHENN